MSKIKSFIGALKGKMRSVPFIDNSIVNLQNYFSGHPYRAHLKLSLILSFFVVLIVQSFECKSFIGGPAFIFKNTYFFILNYLIVFLTYSLLFILKKRLIWISLITVLWCILGVANYIVMLYRAMPIAAIDFEVMTTTRDIIPHYFSIFHIILIALAVITGISYFVYLFIRSKKYTRTVMQAICPIICSSVLLSVFLFGGAATGSLKVSYNDVTAAYNEHGFIYCFTSSLFVRGIPRPTEYSSNDIKKITQKYENIESEETKTPNIIVVQLESFMDPSKYSKYTLIGDPIPNFHRICNEFGEGSVAVPSNGGGTVNTEFEILTGMNLEYFGTIEYPYTTVLKDTTCESAAFILGEYNYTSHAIHNHTGVFYARNQVYPNLGFDNFIPIEFMQHEKTETGWAKDTAIFQSSVEAIESTPGNDFVFAVTVQGHGAYNSEDDPENPFKIDRREFLSGSEFKKACMFEHYCSLLYETDKVIGKLYDYVMNSDEDFVVVLYGDHLPSLEINPEFYEYNSGYMTTYTVFSNMGNEFKYEFTDNLPSFRLMSSVFEVLGIDAGLINRINRNYEDPNYETELGEIQYDMLYGEGYSYGGKPYIKKVEKFGSNVVQITSVTFDDGFLTVRGENFNQKSEININGKERDTAFVDSNTIVCACSKISSEDIISVCQTAVEGTKLYEAFYNPNH